MRNSSPVSGFSQAWVSPVRFSSRANPASCMSSSSMRAPIRSPAMLPIRAPAIIATVRPLPPPTWLPAAAPATPPSIWPASDSSMPRSRWSAQPAPSATVANSARHEPVFLKQLSLIMMSHSGLHTHSRLQEACQRDTQVIDCKSFYHRKGPRPWGPFPVAYLVKLIKPELLGFFHLTLESLEL